MTGGGFMSTTKEKSQVLEMVGLYQKDPEAFEKMRADIIHQMLEDFPEEYRQRAYGMQFQIEMRLRRYRDPIVRMNMMIAMFWEQFEEFNSVLNDPERFIAEREAGQRGAAKVLPLKKNGIKH
ncbi:MAG: DUF3135 domain-containing protein [Pedobacter sp.]